MSSGAWDSVFVAGTVFGALVAARYYVAGVLHGDRLLARSAIIAFFLLTVAGVLYVWRFL